MSVKWDEIKRSMERTFKTNWKLFKQSKLGLVGLGIIIFFVILAVFAPIIPFTYTPEYLAPAGDLYEIDNYTVSIPTNHKWNAPVSIQTPIMMGKPAKIAGILIYSPDGAAYLYPRNFTYNQLLRLEKPIEKSVPRNMSSMEYLKRNKKLIGFSDDAMYLYSVKFQRNEEDIITSSFLENPIAVKYNHTVPYHSNIWDYNLTDPSTGTVNAMVSVAVAQGKNVSLFVWVYQVFTQFGGLRTTHIGHYVYNFTVNSTVAANPAIRISKGESWVIVPTVNSIQKYNINLTKDSSGFIVGIGGAAPDWYYQFNRNGEEYQYISPNTVGLVYSRADQEISSDRDIFVALFTNNYGIGLYADNGTLVWNNTITLNPQDTRIHNMAIKGMRSTVREFMMIYGDTNVGGFVAKLDPEAGKVMENRSAYLVLRGTINYVSEYDVGAQSYYVSTEEGAIYEIKEKFYTVLMGGVKNTGLDKSFMVLGGTSTPAVYLGNVFLAANQVGTYMGVVTKQNTLYFQASSGTRIKTIVIPPFSYGRYSHNFYLFGTDYEGHDIWTWLVYGSRTSLLVGLTAALIAVLVGTFIGIISGFYGGWIDILIMRIVDIILTLPSIVIMLLLAAVLGPNIWNIVLIIALLGWAGIARVIRAVTLSLKNRPFMDAARVAGASNARMITVHIFPNVLPLTFLYMTFQVAGAILSEASLSFLGLGDPNAVSWGMMLQYLRMYGQVTNVNAWGWLLMPGIFITLISLAFYLVGRAFDEIVNPRLRKR